LKIKCSAEGNENSLILEKSYLKGTYGSCLTPFVSSEGILHLWEDEADLSQVNFVSTYSESSLITVGIPMKENSSFLTDLFS